MDHTLILESVRTVFRQRRLSHNTGQAYSYWIGRFLSAHGARDLRTLTGAEIGSFISGLADERNVSAATQRMAMSAISFLYRYVLDSPLEEAARITPRRRRAVAPLILSREEIALMLANLRGAHKLIASLMYGSGLRLRECLELRVCDLDGNLLTVRDVDGRPLRTTLLPGSLHNTLAAHLRRLRGIHCEEIESGIIGARDQEKDGTQWEMRHLFPATHRALSRRICAGAGNGYKLHMDESGLQRGMKRAAARAGIKKPVSPYTFRHSFAVHMLEAGHSLQMVSNLLGHRSIRATMIYQQIMAATRRPVLSPLDFV